MDKKKIIFGVLGLAVVGGVAYFYFKSKSKKTPAQKLMDTLSSSSASSTTSTSSTSNTQSQSNQDTQSGDKVLDNAPVTQTQLQDNTIYNQALALASQIASKRSMLKSGFNLSDADKTNNGYINLDIISLNNKIKALGYKEVNGNAVKL